MAYPSDHIQHIVFHEFYKGSTESQALANIRLIYGQESVDENECNFWYERFRSGDLSLKKKKKIEIAGDVLVEILGWITLKNLHIVSMVSRRYWKCSDYELNQRKLLIFSMQIVGKFDRWTEERYDQVYISKDGRNSKRIQLPEVEPPKNFTFQRFFLRPYYNRGVQRVQFSPETMDFLGKLKSHIKGAKFDLWNDEVVQWGIIWNDYLSEFEPACINIIGMNDDRFSVEFFAKKSIRNCWSLSFYFPRVNYNFFKLISIFDWLHDAQMKFDSNHSVQHRELHLNLPDQNQLMNCSEFVEQLKKKFTEDKEKSCSFILKIFMGHLPEEFAMFRLQNETTKEVLFSRIKNYDGFNNYGFGIHELVEFVRCPIDEFHEFNEFNEFTIEFKRPAWKTVVKFEN